MADGGRGRRGLRPPGASAGRSAPAAPPLPFRPGRCGPRGRRARPERSHGGGPNPVSNAAIDMTPCQALHCPRTSSCRSFELGVRGDDKTRTPPLPRSRRRSVGPVGRPDALLDPPTAALPSTGRRRRDDLRTAVTPHRRESPRKNGQHRDNGTADIGDPVGGSHGAAAGAPGTRCARRGADAMTRGREHMTDEPSHRSSHLGRAAREGRRGRNHGSWSPPARG